MTSTRLSSMSSPQWQAASTLLFRAPAQSFNRALAVHASLEQILNDVGDLKQFPVPASNEFVQFASEPGFRLALRLASPIMYTEMVLALSNQIWTRDLLFTVGRYLVRAATRATPFGLFSGVAMGQVGTNDETVKVDGLGKIVVAFDFAWLMAIQRELQSGESEIPDNEYLLTNSLLRYEGGRARLAYPDIWGRRDAQDVSLRASPPVRIALAAATDGLKRSVLHEKLSQGQKNVSEEAVRVLIDNLVRTGFLLQGSRPTMVRTAEQLYDETDGGFTFDSRHPQPIAVPSVLLDSQSTCHNVAEAINDLLDWQQKVHSSPMNTTLQVDASLLVDSGSFPLAVSQLAREAAEIADLLGSCFGYPKTLSQHLGVFTERYGSSALLPLMDLLSETTGIGPPADYTSPGRSHSLPDLHEEDRREGIYRTARLAAFATKGLLAGGAVDLSDEDVRSLSMSRIGIRRDCASIDVSFIPGRSRGVDGNFVYYGVLGVQPFVPGGKMLGRFARLLGEPALNHLHMVARAEKTARPDIAIVELSYFPTEARAANIAVRPRIHEYELNVNTSTEVSGDSRLTLSDIFVGERDGEYYLYASKLGREISVVQSNMLNRSTAPDALRFLLDVSEAQFNAIAGFEWGALESEMPALPRVTHGRIILSPARWSLRASAEFAALQTKSFAEFAQKLQHWQERYKPPRFVHLITKDNTLLIDLSNNFCKEDLWRAWKSTATAPVTLIEALPSPSDVVAQTSEGQEVLAEVVMTVVRKTNLFLASRVAGKEIQRPLMPRLVVWPGNEWLYLKLYGPQAGQRELLIGALTQLRDHLTSLVGSLSLYFVRYADPLPHLRLRVRTHENRDLVIGLVLKWASELGESGILADVQIATFRPEIERYGGDLGFHMAEAVFCADSDFIMDSLSRGAKSRDQLIVDGVLHLDVMTRIWGLASGEKRRMASHIAGSVSGGVEYRRLGKKIWTAANETCLEDPATRLSETLRSLRSVLDSSRSDDVLTSVLHMHMNRLGIERNIEPVVYGVWRRHLDRSLQGDEIRKEGFEA